MNADYENAKTRFLNGDYSVDVFFKQNNYLLEYAYCKLLSGDINMSATEFSKIKNTDFRANWAIKLVNFIQNSISEMPTYFQIRNFLEIDLNLLLQANQPQFVENIINGADLFYSVNQESYKFISRVMLNNDFTDVALFYLQKAKDKFYCDPEMHLMLANCYLLKGETSQAKSAVYNCLAILPEYFPAKKLLAKINIVE